MKPPLQLGDRAILSPQKPSSHYPFIDTPSLTPWEPLTCPSLSFVFSRMSHKWNHTVYNLLRFSFIQNNAFEIHICYCMYQFFALFYWWLLLSYRNILWFVFDEHLDNFQVLVVINRVAMNILTKALLWAQVFVSLSSSGVKLLDHFKCVFN